MAGQREGQTRLSLWGRYVPVARCPAADRGAATPLIPPLIKDTPSVTCGDSSPKGGAKSRLSPWESCHDVVVTERVSLKGVHKGGGIASPFGIKL